MRDLIEALNIFMKYAIEQNNEYGLKYPTTCDHDMLLVNCVNPKSVSEDDLKHLEELGFVPYENFAFVSYRFGSN